MGTCWNHWQDQKQHATIAFIPDGHNGKFLCIFYHNDLRNAPVASLIIGIQGNNMTPSLSRRLTRYDVICSPGGRISNKLLEILAPSRISLLKYQLSVSKEINIDVANMAPPRAAPNIAHPIVSTTRWVFRAKSPIVFEYMTIKMKYHHRIRILIQ